MSKSIGVLWKVKPFLTCKLLLQVCKSLILSYFSYCNLIWHTASAKRLEKLLILQKKAVRIISKAEFLAQTDPLFNKFGLLKINDIGNLKISIFVYTFLKHDLSKSFNEYFSLNSDSHHYFTRQSSGLQITFANYGMRNKNTRVACM